MKYPLVLMILAVFNPVSADEFDDRFYTNDEGIIVDTETGYRWMVGPDRDMNWDQAHQWINDLEGNWRMPTKYDLWELYCHGVDIYSWGPFDNNGIYVWAFDYQSADMKYLFSFRPENNSAFWSRRYISGSSGIRAFALNSPPLWRRLALYTFRS